jgi:hypothetical protein
MLAGIAGAMLPLVLHLLNRARYRRVRWGAMMFLEPEGDSRHYTSTRLKELSLLLLRMAMVALLAVALARPVVGGSATGSSGTATEEYSATVILLDRSGSMGLDDNGRPRIDPARKSVITALSALRRGDEAALIVMPEPSSEPPRLTTDLQSLATRATGTRPFWGRADIAASLTAAAKVLASSHAVEKRLLLVCDRQAASWRDVNESFARSWRESVGDPQNAAQTPRFIVVPVGGDDAANVAVESVEPVSTPLIRDVPGIIEVRVTNFDSVAHPEIGLTLNVQAAASTTAPATTQERRPLYRTTINLDAGANIVCRCPVRLPAAGPQIIRAALTPAGLGGDDALDSAVEVVDPIDVLVISGDPKRPGNGADFIRIALEPFVSSGQSGPDPARVRIIADENWPPLDRAAERVLILENVARLSSQRVRQIEQFVYGGGGLLVAPGGLSDVRDYNTQLWREGSGVMPAELGLPVATSDSSSAATTLLGLELSHPIFQFLAGREDPIPSGVMIRRYFLMSGSGGGGPPAGRVLGRFASGQPFLVEGSFGRGRVLLFTTALDADWSTLPRSSFYLPMVQSAVRYLASATVAGERNVWAGEPIIASVDDLTDLRADVELPGGAHVPITFSRSGGGYEARFTNTNRPGAYRVRTQTSRGPNLLLFSVRPARDESDVTALSEQRWSQLSAMLGFEQIEDDERPGDGGAGKLSAALAEFHHSRREIWPLVLGGVVALALLELGLTRLWTATEEVSA